ncbi:hypothetical protein [Halococcus sp. PRR34]|uniref:hypothetical protein n=1 Tax=Halococcus sp. PRR34 TaxID=3020830 RepID=UPI0023613106|nr:hypothetical protein [Halococcus sp. PRR34]
MADAVRWRCGPRWMKGEGASERSERATEGFGGAVAVCRAVAGGPQRIEGERPKGARARAVLCGAVAEKASGCTANERRRRE